MRTVVIAVLGEAGTCKSSLVKKMVDPMAEIAPAPADYTFEWDYIPSFPSSEPERGEIVHALASGDTVLVKLLELSAARGRASNFQQVANALRSVHAVIHTDRLFAPVNPDELCKHVPYGRSLNSKSTNARKVPFLYACTAADAVPEERLAVLAERAKAAGAAEPLCQGTFMVSAVTGHGIAELREAAIAAALGQSASESPAPVERPASLAQKLAAFLPWGPRRVDKASPPAEWVPSAHHMSGSLT